MELENSMFYLLGGLILTFGFLSVITRHIFRAAIYLLFSLIGIAGLYFALEYEFLAAVQIVVYVGGIVVLVLFSIFLTHRSGEDLPEPSRFKEFLVFALSFLGFAFTYLIINRSGAMESEGPAVAPTVQNVGAQMLDTTNHGFLLPFEVVSILLLAAMIGAIVIAIKDKASTSKSEKA